MGTLVQCQPHFIRCIKPNPASQPGQLDPEYVLEQLRAGGVLEAVRIACAGFPTRKLFRRVPDAPLTCVRFLLWEVPFCISHSTRVAQRCSIFAMLWQA